MDDIPHQHINTIKHVGEVDVFDISSHGLEKKKGIPSQNNA